MRKHMFRESQRRRNVWPSLVALTVMTVIMGPAVEGSESGSPAQASHRAPEPKSRVYRVEVTLSPVPPARPAEPSPEPAGTAREVFAPSR